MTDKKLNSYIGLCKRAGRLCSGEFQVIKAIKNGDALFVLIAEDASDNTKKKFTDKCKFYEIKNKIYGKKQELGICIGTGERTVLAILDQGFVKLITGRLEEIEQ